MKLLIEHVEPDLIEVIKENVIISDGTSKKEYRLKGPLTTAGVKNKNGRIYPRDTLKKEIERYVREAIQKSASQGTLDHDATPQINLDRISHCVESIDYDGEDNWYGVLRIYDTPCGRIAKTLIEEGMRLGVSSRAVGNVVNGIVNNDLAVLGWDIVQNPSNHTSLMEAIIEAKDWILQGNCYVESTKISAAPIQSAFSNLENKIIKKYNSSQTFNRELMNRFLADLKGRV